MQMVEVDNLMEKWLYSVKDSTAKQYKYNFDRFKRFFGISTQQILDYANDPEQRLELKFMLNKFYKHLRDNGASQSYAAAIEAAVKSFLNYNEVPMKTKARKTPRKHHRKALRKDHIRRMVNVAQYPRDKVLICMAFQSGMSISDLLNLKYEQVKLAIEGNKDVLVIHYTRKKTETEAIALIGKDSITLLKQYINWRKEKKFAIEDQLPLFTSIREFKAEIKLTTRSAQRMLRHVLVRAEFTTFKELEKYGKFNPWGFHAIRKAFSTVAELAGMPKTQIEYSVGHVLDYNGAYKEFTIGEMIENYKKAEFELSIFADEREIIRLKQEVKDEKTKSRNMMIRLLTILQEKYDMKELSEITREVLQP